MKSSSSQSAEAKLKKIQIKRLRSHPANSNYMPENLKQKLTENIRQTSDYPPVIVRPFPDEPETWQIIDGYNRVEVLKQLGHQTVTCYIWPCDDQTALRLLATLNRLEGQDVPARRASLFKELADLTSPEELAQLLPESANEIEQTLSLLEFDVDSLMADLDNAAKKEHATAPRLISFGVLPDDEEIVMSTVDRLAAEMDGKNRRGRALAEICRSFRGELSDA